MFSSDRPARRSVIRRVCSVLKHGTLAILFPAICLLSTGCQLPRKHVPSLSGTRWKGTECKESWECNFKSNGTIRYTAHGGIEYEDGLWEQYGPLVYMSFNNRYAEYYGRIDGAKMSGIAGNIKHKNCDWRLSLNNPK